MENEKKQSTSENVGTIVYYGPDDHTITKIVVSVFDKGKRQIGSREWHGEKVAESAEVVKEIGAFLKELGASKVAITEKPVGCPHVEGIDYPKGEECPKCPFWAKKKNDEKG